MVVAFHFFGQLAGWHMRAVPSDWFESYLDRADAEAVARFAASYLYLGVNVFVIASGFGLYYSYLKRGGAIDGVSFWRARLGKLLLPAAFSVVLAFLVKGLLLDGYPTSYPLRNLYPFLAGFNLLSDQWFYPPVNGDTWFIGLIIQLYIVFPALVLLLERLGESRFLLATLAASTAFRALWYADMQHTVSCMSYGFFLGRLFEFGFGMVVARRAFNGVGPSAWWILGLGAFWGYFYPPSFPFADCLTGVGTFAAIWYAAGPFGAAGRAFAFLSRQSYMIFLIHHPLLWVAQRSGLRMDITTGGVLAFMAFSAGVTLLAWLCNVLLRLLSGAAGGMLAFARVELRRVPVP
jgi:peptidoglycan/LPS O-acetylase OafA/YrhL